MRGKADTVHLQINQQAKDLFEDAKAKVHRHYIVVRKTRARSQGRFKATELTVGTPFWLVTFKLLETTRCTNAHTYKMRQLLLDGILDKTVSEVNKLEFFAVLSDETSDISRNEQFSLRVRYADPEILCIREDLLTFVAVEDVTASSFVHTLERELVILSFKKRTSAQTKTGHKD